jgi:hypothetical protein
MENLSLLIQDPLPGREIPTMAMSDKDNEIFKVEVTVHSSWDYIPEHRRIAAVRAIIQTRKVTRAIYLLEGIKSVDGKDFIS